MSSEPTKRKGKVSRNPILLILDFFCQRMGEDGYMTLWMFISSYAFGLNLMFFYYIFGEIGIDTSWVFYTPLVSLFCLDNIYHHYRNKYLKKHNLPGPFGYGSIDCFESRY